MLHLVVKTKNKPGEIVKKALEFFGPGGYGLKIIDKSEYCAYFQGGIGGIVITTNTLGEETSVNLVTKDWEYQVGEYARRI